MLGVINGTPPKNYVGAALLRARLCEIGLNFEHKRDRGSRGGKLDNSRIKTKSFGFIGDVVRVARGIRGQPLSGLRHVCQTRRETSTQLERLDVFFETRI